MILRKSIIWLLVFIAALLAPRLFPGPPSAEASGPAGVQLFVTPNKIRFRLGPPPSVAVCEVTIRVIAPRHTPWRLTALAAGPLRTRKGAAVKGARITWKGSPGHIFLEGALSDRHPQLIGRGQGPKTGVVRFLLKNGWGLAAGQFNQRFQLILSSP